MTGTVLILGATGRFGRNTGAAFRQSGWAVRTFDRKTDDLMTAADGADVIVNGWNPPYPDWARTVPGLTQQVIAAARAAGATVIMPGNVYVFGRRAPDRFAADTAHGATNPLGMIRRDMEAAYAASGVQTILLRAGDFIDTEGSGNWFDQVLTKNIAKGRLTYPGPPDTPHAWAYLPDMARAAVQLAEMRDRLGRFEDIPFPGYTLSGRELAAAIAGATGKPVHLKRMHWLPLYLARPFWPMAKHLIEMGYLWSKPHHLDGARLKTLLPDFAQTPVETALASALQVQIDPDQAVARRADRIDQTS
jgi:nucleoside-diphosphate-sugar epimerase